jgi:hypothetical protein
LNLSKQLQITELNRGIDLPEVTRLKLALSGSLIIVGLEQMPLRCTTKNSLSNITAK